MKCVDKFDSCPICHKNKPEDKKKGGKVKESKSGTTEKSRKDVSDNLNRISKISKETGRFENENSLNLAPANSNPENFKIGERVPGLLHPHKQRPKSVAFITEEQKNEIFYNK